jgi:hypothetical protein
MSTGSLLIVCCLASTPVAAVAAAAEVINARSHIVAIEWEGSKLSFNALGQCADTAQMDGLHHACCGSPGEGVGGDTHLCLPPKLTK